MSFYRYSTAIYRYRGMTRRACAFFDASSIASMPIGRSRAVEPPFRCGYDRDCPRRYSLDEINQSAARWALDDSQVASVQHEQHKLMRDACAGSGKTNTKILNTGGWCVKNGPEHIKNPVTLANNHTYLLTYKHVTADRFLVVALHALLTRRLGSTRGNQWLSVSDFGAGVGQLGHTLLSIEPTLRYHGYDGAGNVEAVTNGFLSYADLTLPLALPRRDWVISMEVGEHLPWNHEKMFVRNLHAHNCRGVILSWAQLSTWVHGHINNHRLEYVREVFEGLGYRNATDITSALRYGTGINDVLFDHPSLQHPLSGGYWWFRRNTTVAYERIVPLQTEGCTIDPQCLHADCKRLRSEFLIHWKSPSPRSRFYP